jgi:hypothetical protein
VAEADDAAAYWADYETLKREARKTWAECPTCRARFGSGTLVPPGEECRNCGWLAPGERSDRTSLGYRRGRRRR